MEDPENDCPVCFESMKKTTVIRVHCCEHMLHLSCYMKCGQFCPMCRTEQPHILPVYIIKTDWPRITKSVCLTILVTSCISISMLLGFSEPQTSHQNL